jgi:putative thioredoxin
MIDVTIENFEVEVIQASNEIPVLVDFWAAWCGPCRTLGPILEKLEAEYAGGFKLVKVDADTEQQLAGAFGIQSLPTCVLLKNGQPVDGFMGALPPQQVREFLNKHVTPMVQDEAPVAESEPEPEQAAAGGATTALEQLAQAVQANPDDDGARFAYLQQLLLQHQLDLAREVLAPVEAKTAADRKLAAAAQWLQAVTQGQQAQAPALQAAIAANKRDFDARLALAAWHLHQQQPTAAMDELLEILMRDKTWQDDAARKLYVAILEVMEPPKPKVADGQVPPEDPVVASYRRRLSSVVLS